MMNKLCASLCRPLYCLFALVLLALAGCGATTGDVTGTVTYQGKTVASGTVIIAGSDSLPYYGTIEDDGSYIVPMVPIGSAKIAVVSPGPDAGKNRASPLKTTKSVKPSAPPPVRGDPNKWFALPDEYRHFDTSNLTVAVTGGVNRRDIELD
jgi:hypothetical protein